MSGIMVIAVCFVLVFRVLIEKFCTHAEYKKRLMYVVGMMLCYTAILSAVIYTVGVYVASEMTVKAFVICICTIICPMNLALIFIIALYCSTARKRLLSSSEKIKLKDL